MICKLCQKERVLIKSHIVPEWAYTTLYNKKGHFKPINVNSSLLGKAYQNGFKEELLCEECDRDIIGKYDEYAKNLFFSIANDKYKNINKTRICSDIFILKGVNYKITKLFLLSLLWRMSVTSLEVFAEYKISDYEEEIRDIIYKGKEVHSTYIPIAISKMLIGNEYKNDVLMTFPGFEYINKIARKRIVIKGIVVDYFIDTDCADEKVNIGCINETGNMIILEQAINRDVIKTITSVINKTEILNYYGRTST